MSVRKQLWCFMAASGMELTREILVLTSSLAEACDQARAQLEPGERIIGNRLPTFIEVRSHE